MTEITFFYHGKKLIGIEGQGHSGYRAKGEDVVCAAVSTLLNSLLLGLIEVAGLRSTGARIDDNIPLMSVIWSEADARKVALLTRTVELSLRTVASDNPNYIKISEVHSK